MKQQPLFISKQLERVAYVFLIISLGVGYSVATFFTWFPFLVIQSRKNKKDFLFLPYTYKDNTGTISRFQVYLPYLEKDGYTYDIDYLYDEAEYTSHYFWQKSRTKEYLLNHRVFWRRLGKVLSAKNYKGVFFHRAVFPEYYDKTFPYLERLLSKLNNNVTVDFFDAEYARNKKLIDTTVSFCNKVCVVNKHLYDYFSKIHPRVYYNNLAIDTAPYVVKKNFDLQKPVNIFWTGSITNAVNLQLVLPVLEKINKEVPLKLTMICKSNGGYTSAIIETHPWEAETFFTYMADGDIAIYPAMEDTEYSRGKVAFKVLDYVAAKVPVVASPLGLSQNFEDEKDVLVANTEAEWEAAIRQLISDKQLRIQLAENAYQKLLQYHYVEATYKSFIKILLS